MEREGWRGQEVSLALGCDHSAAAWERTALHSKKCLSKYSGEGREHSSVTAYIE